MFLRINFIQHTEASDSEVLGLKEGVLSEEILVEVLRNAPRALLFGVITSLIVLCFDNRMVQDSSSSALHEPTVHFPQIHIAFLHTQTPLLQIATHCSFIASKLLKVRQMLINFPDSPPFPSIPESSQERLSRSKDISTGVWVFWKTR